MNSVHSSREAGSAQGPPSATERRECKSRVTLLLRDANSGQIDHMADEPTHGPHHPCTSSSRLGARGTLLAIANVSLPGGSTYHGGSLGLEGRSKFKELLAAGAPRHPIGRFRPCRPGGSGTFSNFERWAPEVAF